MITIKKVIAYLLIGMVMFFTIIAVLGIWDIINLEQVIRKSLSTLLIVFAASGVILFIFSVMNRD